MSPKTPSPMIATLLILGRTVFGVLGVLHTIYTVLDLRNPRRLAPVDPSVAHAMANSVLRLSGGRTDMWRAWIGFNFSHSLGCCWLQCWRSGLGSEPKCSQSASSCQR